MEGQIDLRLLLNSIQSPTHLLQEQATMTELTQKGYPSWKENLIQDLFSSEEVQLIKSIPLNGLFTIKSAYRLHKSIKASMAIGSSQGNQHKEAWKLIGKLKVPNAVKKRKIT